MAEATEGTPLIFNYNGFATEPFELRRFLPFLPFYSGEALLFWGTSAFGRALRVPPNTVAVVSLSDSRQAPRILPTGSYPLAQVAPEPLSVQFVSIQLRSFDFDEIKVHTKEHLVLDLDLRLSLQVHWSAADKITSWQAPEADLRAVLMKALVAELGQKSHEECHAKLPELLQGSLRKDIVEQCAAYGVEVKALNLVHFHPDEGYTTMARESSLGGWRKQDEHSGKIAQLKREEKELEEREKLVAYRRFVEQVEAQAKEDVFAIQQPSFRRGALTDINKQLREYNQNARMEAIKAVSDVVKALVEEMHRHPGVRTPGETDNLAKAMALLEKLSAPDFIKAPPIPQQLRSKFAVDTGQPEPPVYERPSRPTGEHKSI